MADVTITAANVRVNAGARTEDGIAGTGATLAPGDVLTKNSSNQLVKADATATNNLYTCAGFCVSYADAGDRVTYAVYGPVEVGGTLTAGAAYGVSGTSAGGLEDMTALTTGDVYSQLGVAVPNNILWIQILNTGVEE